MDSLELMRMMLYGPCEACGEPRDFRKILTPEHNYHGELFCPACETRDQAMSRAQARDKAVEEFTKTVPLVNGKAIRAAWKLYEDGRQWSV